MKKFYPLLFLFLLCGNIKAQTIDLPAGGDLAATVAGLTAGTAVINLPAGTTYAGAGLTITVPLNVNLTISGPATGVKPIIQYKLFDVTDNTTTSISFVNVELVCGTGATDQYLFNFGTARICTMTKIEFKNCVIRDYLRSVVRSQGTPTVINEIIFDNCIIKNIGIESGQNYVLVNGAGEIKKITVKNSTLTNLVKGFIDLKTVGADEINLLDCTFNDNVVDTRSFFNLQSSITKTALAVNVTNTIFGSTKQTTNGVKGINNAASATYIITQTVTNSFKTSDWILLSGDFDNLTAYSGVSTALFTNPAAGDYTFKDVDFTGKYTAGDPRWRSVPTGINGIENNKSVRVLRNTIEVNSEIAEISIYNLQGKLLKKTVGSQISTEELHSGVYVVSILSAGKRYTSKFVKQ
jgi:hypothetical protein